MSDSSKILKKKPTQEKSLNFPHHSTFILYTFFADVDDIFSM